MRNTLALRNLFGWLGLFTLVLGVLGIPIALSMQPPEQGFTFLIATLIAVLIAVVFFVGSAILTAIMEMRKRSR